MTRTAEAAREISTGNSILVDRDPGIDEVQVHHLTNDRHYVVVMEECGVKERDDGSHVLELVIKEEGEDEDRRVLLRECLSTLNHLCACPGCAELCERLRNALGERSRHET